MQNAACAVGEKMTEIGCLPTDPIAFIARFYGIGLSLIGGVSMLFIIIGGYVILTSRGNPQQLNVGKSYIFYAIVGLLLAIFGFVFVQIIVVDLFHVPGFQP
jgi:hypothetical protein